MVASTFILDLLSSSKVKSTYSEDDILRDFRKWVEEGADLRASREQQNTVYQAIAIGWEKLALAIASHPKYQAEENYEQDKLILHFLAKNAKYLLLRDFLTHKYILKGKEKKIVSKLWDEYFIDPKKTELVGIIKDFSPKVSQLIQRRYPKPEHIPHKEYESTLRRTLKFSPKTQSTYESVMKRNFMKISLFMQNKDAVVYILQKFEKVLAKEWQAKFPNLSVQKALGSGYIFEEYLGSQWPIPTAQFADFKKNGFLQCVTKDYLQTKHAIGNQFYKFYFFVPGNNFREIIEQGAIFTESSLNPVFLMHGKAIHNIARILLLDAWDELRLGLRYESQSKTQSVTPGKLIKAMFDEKFCDQQGLIPWIGLFDSKAPHFTLSDPWQFQSFLMHDCQNTLPHLSLLMTHSFCKSVRRIKRFLEDTTKEAWDIDKVWKLYITPRVPTEIDMSFDAEIKWMKSTGRLNKITPLTQEKPVLKHRLG